MPAPIVAAAAAPAAAAVSPWLLGGIAAGQTLASSAFNAWQAEGQKDFQREMANTAHQREVKDLRAAGLNPMLSVRHGGAAVPGGASAQANSHDVAGNVLQAQLAKGQMAVQAAQVNDLNSAARLKDEQTADTNLTRQSRIDLMIAQKTAALASGSLSSEQVHKVKQEIVNLQATKDLVSSQTAHSAAQLHKEQVKGELWKIPENLIRKTKEKVPSMWQRTKEWFRKQNPANRQRGASGRW